MGPRQLRGGRARPVFCRIQHQLAGLRGRERGDRAGDRLGDRLDRRAHQCAAQGARLSHRDHLARHALHPLRHRLAVVLRQGRPGQSSLPDADRNDRRLDQHLLHARHGPGRGLPLVAACLPSRRRDAAQRQSRARRGGAGERRRRLGHHSPGDHAAVAAFDHGAVDAGLHPRDRGLRGAGPGRAARPRLGAHDRYLHQHGGKGPARCGRRERAFGADAPSRPGAAHHLRAALASPPSPAKAFGRAPSIWAACAMPRLRCSSSISSCCSWCRC